MELFDALPSIADPDRAADDVGDPRDEDELLAIAAGFGLTPGADAMASLPNARNKRTLGLYTSDLYRSDQHMEYVRQCKKLKRAERAAQKASSLTAERKAWNEQRMRMGDRLGAAPDSEAGLHPNVWPIQSVAIAAYKQVGHKQTTRVGLDAMSRELAVAASMAGISMHLHHEWMDTQVQRLRASKQPWVSLRFYDATPKDLYFGRLQASLETVARYPFYDGRKWTCLRLDEYRAKCSTSRLLHHGVLDLLASSFKVVTADSSGLMDGFSALCPAQVLGDSGSSCLHQALEEGLPQFSAASVREIAKDTPLAIMTDQPDACNTNQRSMSCTECDLSGIRNVFFYKGRCGGHQCHRTVEKNERRSIGDTHAVIVSCSHPQHGQSLVKSLRKFCDAPQIFLGKPPEEFMVRNRKIAEHTWLRRLQCVCRDSMCDASYLSRPCDDKLVAAVDRFLRVWNGDWASSRVGVFIGTG